MKNILFIIISFYCAINAHSQIAEKNDAKISFELKQEIVSITLQNSELSISSDVYEKRNFQEKVSPTYASDRIYHGFFTAVSNINASVSNLNKKKKYKTQNITDIPEKADFSGSTFYDDNSYFEIAYPHLDSGSITELNYKVAINDPHFMRRFYFSEYYPIKNANYVIQAPENVAIGWKIYGDQKDDIDFSQSTEKGITTYKWVLKNSEALTFESDNLGYLHNATHIITYVKSYKVKEEKISVLENLDDLYKWYQSFLQDIKPSDNAELEAITTQLIVGAKSDLDKTERIFQWVQGNIRYVAFEEGWRGFVPYPAAEICSKRYGDCKDMTHIMYEMLKFAGVKAEHAWVGTRSLPYRYQDNPTPSVDNHLVLSVILNDSVYILDATNAHTPFGIPTTFILGKQLFFKGAGDSYQLYDIPEYNAEFCTVKEDVKARLTGDNVVGEFGKSIETFEYAKFHNLYGISNTNREKFLKEYMAVGQNNFELDAITIDTIQKKAKTKISASFNLPNYVNKFGETVYLNLNLTKPFAQSNLAADRRFGYEINYKRKYVTNVVFEIPEGKSVIGLPAPFNFESSVGSCTATYKIEGNKLIYNRSVAIEKLAIHKEDFKTWNNFIKQLQQIYSTVIELN